MLRHGENPARSESSEAYLPYQPAFFAVGFSGARGEDMVFMTRVRLG